MIRTPDQRLRVFVSSTLGELAGAVEALRRRAGLAVWPAVGREEADLAAQIRKALGADRFDKAYAAGARLNRRDAVAAARDQHTGTPGVLSPDWPRARTPRHPITLVTTGRVGAAQRHPPAQHPSPAAASRSPDILMALKPRPG